MTNWKKSTDKNGNEYFYYPENEEIFKKMVAENEGFILDIYDGLGNKLKRKEVNSGNKEWESPVFTYLRTMVEDKERHYEKYNNCKFYAVPKKMENILNEIKVKTLEDMISDYVNYKNSSDYDEKYKWDFATKHQGIFNDLSNLPEKISSLGAPNFQSYFIQNSGIKWLMQNHPEKLPESFSALFDPNNSLKTRIVSFRKIINDTLINDIGWKNKKLADPGIDTASFFLFANDYISNILFTKVTPFNNYAKIFKLDKMLKFTDYEQRYSDWQDYFSEILIPTMDKVLGTSNTLLDAQDFIWYVGNINNSDNKMQNNTCSVNKEKLKDLVTKFAQMIFNRQSGNNFGFIDFDTMKTVVGFGDTPYFSLIGYQQDIRNGIYPLILVDKNGSGVDFEICYGVSMQTPQKMWEKESIQGLNPSKTTYKKCLVKQVFNIKNFDDFNNSADEIVDVLSDIIVNYKKIFEDGISRFSEKEAIRKWLIDNNFEINDHQNVFPPGSNQSPGSRIMGFRGSVLRFRSKLVNKYPKFRELMTDSGENNLDLEINPNEVALEQIIEIITTLSSDLGYKITSNISKEITNKGNNMHNQILLNQILYGPPGTGKTYSTKEIKNSILNNNFSENKSEFNKSVVNDVVKDLYWYSAIALSMYLNGKDKNYKVKELENHDIISAFSATRSSKNVYLTISAQLQIHTSIDSKFVNYTNKTSPAIFEKTENAEWYLTESGIKYVEEDLEPQLSLLQGKQTIDKDKFSQFITFHQSYSYEEFIEGIRPNIDSETDAVSYELKNGIFKEMCIKANSDPYNNYVLVIDEINRGNISKIFGELITLIENDKRVDANGEFNFENTQVKNNELLVTLPYSQKKFGVPNNLYIVGTMNTSDRSIAAVDIALRRRFEFKEIMPEPKLVPNKIEGLDADFREIFEIINKKISILLDREHQIGHSYFIKVKNINDLKEVWFNNIIPLLNEYFYGEWDKLKEIIPTFVNEIKINDLIISSDLADEYYYDFHKESDFNSKMPFEDAIKLLQTKNKSENSLTMSSI